MNLRRGKGNVAEEYGKKFFITNGSHEVSIATDGEEEEKETLLRNMGRSSLLLMAHMRFPLPLIGRVKGIFLRLLRRVYIMGLCIVFNRCGMLHSVSALMNDRANGKTKSEVDE
nr:hypothetical protein [Tanacetum cinerariifolium]